MVCRKRDGETACKLHEAPHTQSKGHTEGAGQGVFRALPLGLLMLLYMAVTSEFLLALALVVMPGFVLA